MFDILEGMRKTHSPRKTIEDARRAARLKKWKLRRHSPKGREQFYSVKKANKVYTTIGSTLPLHDAAWLLVHDAIANEKAGHANLIIDQIAARVRLDPSMLDTPEKRKRG